MGITCFKCGLIDDYRTEKKANNLVAYCNGCDSYIKNIPYATPTLHFGKYKGSEIKDIEDVGYLQWVINNVKLSEVIRHAVNERISSLNLTHR